MSESGGGFCLLIVKPGDPLNRRLNVHLPHVPCRLPEQGSDGSSRAESSSPFPPFYVSVVYQGADVFEGGHIRRGKVEMRHVGGKLQIVDGNIASGIFVCQEVAIVGIIHG